MYEKIKEYDFDGRHCSLYKNNGVIWPDFVNTILDNGYDIAQIGVSDTMGDVGMKYGGRSYSNVEEFLKEHPELEKYCDTLKVRLKYAATMITVKDYDDIIMSSVDRDLDLNDLVAQKTGL